jgi:hypothetical protein
MMNPTKPRAAVNSPPQPEPDGRLSPEPQTEVKRRRRQTDGVLPIAPMLDLASIARVLSVSLRTVCMLRASGRLPPPDLQHGRLLRWWPETIQAWIEAEAARRKKGGRA